MQIDPTIELALEQLAWRHTCDPGELRAAFEQENPILLAHVLRIAPEVAEGHMRRVQRAVTVQGDVGAGCKLLTDATRDELLAALAAI
jgi:hypothetical protein